MIISIQAGFLSVLTCNARKARVPYLWINYIYKTVKASKCLYFKDKFWYPERDFGEEINWVPSYLNPLSCVGERTLGDVEFLLWCFLIQMIFCAIGMFLGCVGFMCKGDDGSNQSKSG